MAQLGKYKNENNRNGFAPLGSLGLFTNGGKGSGNFGHSGRPGQVGGSGKGNVSPDRVAQATMLRDYTDMGGRYDDKEHEMLADIADTLYNAGLGPEHLKAEYKELYDKYGKEYFDDVLSKMGNLDKEGQTRENLEKEYESSKEKSAGKSTSGRKEGDTVKEKSTKAYFDEYDTGMTPYSVSKDGSTYTVESMGTAQSAHDIMEAYGKANKVSELPYERGAFKDATNYEKEAGMALTQAANVMQRLAQKMGDHSAGLSTDFSQDVWDAELDKVSRLSTAASLAMTQERNKDSAAYKKLRKAQDQIQEGYNLLAKQNLDHLRAYSEKLPVDVSDLFKK